MKEGLQWGGRFSAAPDAQLLAFGSSLEDDLVLAPFDVRCSLGHVRALESGAIISRESAQALRDALAAVAGEIEAGTFTPYARSIDAEDVHGAIDRRVRDFAPGAGESLHAGRSRNDQVATTLLLYARDRAGHGRMLCVEIARIALEYARAELEARTLVAATTHWQPAQPVLLAFWLHAVAESFARAAHRFAAVERDAARTSPLGSGACSGSTLPLDREAAARELGFDAPANNALDAVGNRDVALDLLHAVARAVATASRPSEEFIIWCTPAFGYARLGDAASTGSSLMPQKRNPDPFELVRASASVLNGTLSGAIGSASGIALSYHRDLQETKALIVRGTERGLAALDAFARAFAQMTWHRETLSAHAGDGYTVATDIADALIARGVPARRAHELVGYAVAAAEAERRPLGRADLNGLAASAKLSRLDAPLLPLESTEAKRTSGSTNPAAVGAAIAATAAALESLQSPAIHA